MKKIIFLLTLLSYSIAYSQSKVGTSAVDFLNIGIGPNAIGMGSAGVALTAGPTSLYWNPGALGLKPKNEVSFSQMKWLVQSKYNWLGTTFALSDASVIGFQFAHINYGEEEVTTESQPSGTGDRWDANELFLAVAYSQALTDQFSIGGNVKYIRSQIWHEIATSFALDIGLLYITDWKALRLGMSVSNFGSDIRYEGKDLLKSYDSDPQSAGNNGTIPVYLKVDPWPLPILFRVGVSMEAYQDDINRLTVALDALKPSNNNESINTGFEYGYSEMIFLRAGYKNLFLDDSKESFSFGFGAKYPVANYNLKFDLSYQKFEIFDSIMNYSVTLEF